MKGIYVLEIELEKDRQIEIGALGKISFEKGRYAYVGSAQNSVEKRVQRHLSDTKKLHWHIDYFLDHTKITKIHIKKAGKEQECITAKKIQENNKPIEKFGCSDCSCVSHLFRINNLELEGFTCISQ